MAESKLSFGFTAIVIVLIAIVLISSCARQSKVQQSPINEGGQTPTPSGGQTPSQPTPAAVKVIDNSLNDITQAVAAEDSALQEEQKNADLVNADAQIIDEVTK